MAAFVMCGAVASAALTPVAQYRAAVTRTCDAAGIALRQVPTPKTAAGITPYVVAIIPIYQHLDNRLQALKPPKRFRVIVVDVLRVEASELAGDRRFLAEIQAGGDPYTTFARMNAAQEKLVRSAKADWKQLGITACG
jgi:hypothetical protein